MHLTPGSPRNSGALRPGPSRGVLHAGAPARRVVQDRLDRTAYVLALPEGHRRDSIHMYTHMYLHLRASARSPPVSIRPNRSVGPSWPDRRSLDGVVQVVTISPAYRTLVTIVPFFHSALCDRYPNSPADRAGPSQPGRVIGTPRGGFAQTRPWAIAGAWSRSKERDGLTLQVRGFRAGTRDRVGSPPWDPARGETAPSGFV